MNLTKIALKLDRVTFILIAIIILAGIFAYKSMPQTEDPEIIIRTALVMTYFPGASPERIEMLVTDKLEKKIQEMPEIKDITSESRQGISIIYVTVQAKYKKMRPIWDDLRDKVKKATPELPNGIDGPYVNDDFGDVFGIVIAITGSGFSYRELKDIADDLRDELLLVKDVARIDLYGIQEERVFIEFSNSRLAELGMSPVELASALQDQNIIMSGGNIITKGERIILEPSGEFESIEDIRRSVISLPGGKGFVYLGDVADVKRGYIDPPESMMRYKGKRCIGLAVSMSSEGNIVELGKRITKKLDEIIQHQPVGVDFNLVAYQPEMVTRAIDEFMGNLYQAIIIVLIVMFLFLGLRVGIIVGSLIPMAILMTFALMSVFGITMQRVSIASLIIAIGLLVDNGVVMSENIIVRLKNGEKRLDACIGAGKELAIPLLTSTLTTCTAFLPIALAKSMVGEYCMSLFQVVSLTLLSSWFLTMTVIPLFCFYFLKTDLHEKEQSYDTPFYKKYHGFLSTLLTHRIMTLIVVVIIFIVSMWGFGFVEKIFFPPSDRNQFVIDFQLPDGASLEKTASEVAKLEEWLQKHESITNFATYIGNGGPRFYLSLNPTQASRNYAFIMVNTVDFGIAEELVPEVRAYIEENFADVQPRVSLLESGAAVGVPIQIRISGKDTETLYRISSEIKELLAKTQGTINISDNWGEKIKKLKVDIEQSKAKQIGITSADIAQSLKTQLSGTSVTEYREGAEVIPVIMRSTAAEREDIGKLDSITVFSTLGGVKVPLMQLANTRLEWGPSKILRRDRKRVITVNSDVQGRNTMDILEEIRPDIEKMARTWPLGYTYEFGGEDEGSREANEAIMAQVPFAGFIILLILIAQFNSVRKMLIIVIVIPLEFIGVTVGMLVTRSAFGFMAMLGMISLSGIVINNAIILIDRIKLEIDEGRSPSEAILSSAQKRLRPIFLTTATTVLGLIPLALNGGLLWAPMAYVIMFGLLFATGLTLGVVPVLYSLFFRVSYRKKQ